MPKCQKLIQCVCLQVFYPGNECPVFFVANRGHHADIGGISPGKTVSLYCLQVVIFVAGSMPPHSKYLWEEGVCVKSFKIVEHGVFQEEGQCYFLLQ